MPRKHKLMLVLALELLWLGFAQAGRHPGERGVAVEPSMRPNHVVT